MVSNAILIGLLGTAALLAAYFAIVTAISGMDFALSQFSAFWYFILGLSLGFGIQIGLYNYLKNLIQRRSAPATVVAVSGMVDSVATFLLVASEGAGVVLNPLVPGTPDAVRDHVDHNDSIAIKPPPIGQPGGDPLDGTGSDCKFECLYNEAAVVGNVSGPKDDGNRTL